MNELLKDKLKGGALFIGTYLPIDDNHPLWYRLEEENATELMISIDEWEAFRNEASKHERADIGELISIGLTNIVINKKY